MDLIPETTPGGTALKFYSHLRLKAHLTKPSPTTPGAFIGKLKIVKNKSCPPVNRDITFEFLYGKGPDRILDILNTAKDLGILAFAGPNLKMQDEKGDTSVLCSGGANGFVELAGKDPTILDRITQLCLNKSSPIESNEETTITPEENK